MSGVSSTDSLLEPSGEVAQFEQLSSVVGSEFDVEEGFIEYGIPTFRVRLGQDSKQAFLRLIKRLDGVGFVPVLRKRGEEILLQTVRKLFMKPGRRIINVLLFLATIVTTLITGYVLSLGWVERGLMQHPMVGAAVFTAAIMAIFGAHEMAHKLAAHKHGIEASYPYFIPGPPAPIGIGTFGAVIQQRSLAPNSDALFDLGVSGPIVGFIVTIIVTIFGVQWSLLIPRAEVPPGTGFIQVPMLFQFIAIMFPPAGTGDVTWLHPVAFAGWIGMLVTMLNLVPVGMLDGGHATRGLLGKRSHAILSFLGILTLLVLGHWPMAMIALLLSLRPHPGSLDDVSKLAIGRKLAALALILIFIVSAFPIELVLRLSRLVFGSLLL